MAQTLGQTAVGTIVKFPENGILAEFYIVHQGNPSTSIYSSEWNNMTYLMRKKLLAESRASATNWASLESYYNTIDEPIRSKIPQVHVPYNTTNNDLRLLDNGLLARMWYPAAEELAVAWTANTGRLYGGAGVRLSMFMNVTNSFVQDEDVSPEGLGTYHVRTPYSTSSGRSRATFRTDTNTSDPSKIVKAYGSSPAGTYPDRPFFLLPQTLTVLDDGTISIAAVPPVSCTFYNLVVMQNQPVTINWTASPNGTSYILQRKSSADADWVQVYSGSDLTFTETVGSNWTSVQYQVAAVMDGNTSAYTQSVVHDVVTTAALVISGQDGNLGTITSDVSYSIISDTGNQISITRKVNDIEVYSGTVSTGFTYNIPIVDLPTGTDNTIEINASVQSSGGSTITQTRTWTYTKTPIAFSSSGGVSELRENDGAIWPATIQEAVRTYDFMGGTLDKTLMRLSNAVIKDPVTGGLVGFEGQDIGAAQIYVGSYVGTGTYGERNPTTITVPFTPIAIMIYTVGSGGSFSDNDSRFLISWNNAGYLDFTATSTLIRPYDPNDFVIYFNENNVTLISYASSYQYNKRSVTYYYQVFGGVRA